MMEQSINEKIELWREPITGVMLPFVDMRLVQGRVELPDTIYTYVHEEVNGQRCLVQLSYERWPEAANWVEQSPVELGRGRSTAVLPIGLVLWGVIWLLFYIWAWARGGG